jgi:hypothetical protein
MSGTHVIVRARTAWGKSLIATAVHFKALAEGGKENQASSATRSGGRG